ncbi:MAG: FecR domain-containing protein [Ardenticatenaceae bacterium]|nr:FecR domain-containing protein [Ardenticatenaceae bacterium]MCB8986317.1 FecR domain-containing protein [Ardenticatenaceae bacterium]
MSHYSEAAYVERQRLSWIVLLASFSICMIFTVAVPVGVNAALQNMKLSLNTVAQANQGTVRVDNARGESQVIIAGENGLPVAAGARVLTDETSTASLLVYPPDLTENPLARLQIYSRSLVNLNEASAPRFGLSDEAQKLELHLDNGRIQLTVLQDEERPFAVSINTPHGLVFVSHPGQYAVVVDNEETQISVQEGQADVLANSQGKRLGSGQRAEIPANGDMVGPLTTDRNLIRNGDFYDSWADWSLYVWNVELSDQPEGTSEIVEVSGEPGVEFTREGTGHADVRMRQVIGQDVTDYDALRLLLTFQITSHSLGVCGVQGSECPLFVRLNYTDDRGVKRTWQHGFYSTGDVSPTTPDACVSCAVVQDTHQRVPLGQVSFYEADLLEELARQGAPLPAFIEDVSLVASGHSFQVEILDVALMVEE